MSLPTNFDILRTIQEEHKEAHNNKLPLTKDESCVLCNPVKHTVNKNFKNFWKWISSEYNTTSYSNTSLIAFTLYLQSYRENAHNSEKTSKAVIALLYCLNYSLYPSDLTTVLQHLLLITNHTKCFKRPFNPSIKPLTPIPKSTTKTMDKDQLKALIDSITKGFKDVAKDLKDISKGSTSGGTGYALSPKESNIISVKPFCGNDDEDPGDWIRNFEIAAEANNWTNEHKLKIVPGYLQGLAAYWFEENTDTITRWKATGYDDSSFVPCFLNKFSTEEKQNLWHHQLNELRQGPYEKVDFYAGKFKKLLKKVDPSLALPNSYTVRLFLNGLRKNIVPLVAFTQPDTVDKAITIAKQVESGQYYETQASTPTSGNDAIDILTKQMEKLSLNYANITAALAAQLDDKKPR